MPPPPVPISSDRDRPRLAGFRAGALADLAERHPDRGGARGAHNPPSPTSTIPVLEDWLSALRSSLDGLPDDGFDIVTHSLGAVLWLHHAAATPGSPRPARVALVAPPSPAAHPPEVAGFFPPPLDIDSVRHAADGTVLVGGSDDPHCPEGIAEAYGRPLKMATTVIEGGGHLNAESGFGEWPAVLDWCRRDNLAFF